LAGSQVAVAYEYINPSTGQWQICPEHQITWRNVGEGRWWECTEDDLKQAKKRADRREVRLLWRVLGSQPIEVEGPRQILDMHNSSWHDTPSVRAEESKPPHVRWLVFNRHASMLASFATESEARKSWPEQDYRIVRVEIPQG
jgi:hypothetical protein